MPGAGALLLSLAMLSCNAGMSLAESSQADTVQKAMETFARGHPQCQSLTDGCVICAIEGQVFTCSTPQTACVQKAYSCTRPQADKAE